MYSTINNMASHNSCGEAPVCPPMWNCPLKNVTPEIPYPDFDSRSGARSGTYSERVLRRPINPFPGGDPDLAIKSSNTPGSASAGSSTVDKNEGFCRQCGPEIQGVIGRDDPNSPWPLLNASGAEEGPFLGFPDFNSAVPATYRTAGVYTSYDNYRPNQIATVRINNLNAAAWPVDATEVDVVVLNNSPVEVPPSSGTLWFQKETIQYSGVQVVNAANKLYKLTGLTRNLPQGQRAAMPFPATAILTTGPPTGNNSASLSITVAADRSVPPFGPQPGPGIALVSNLSRGSNYSSEGIGNFIGGAEATFFLIPNSYLGGLEHGGCAFFIVALTSWPDEDVTTCIVAEDPSKIDIARQYCCFKDSLTADDWAGGAGRCAALAQYSVGRPFEWAQHCPDGYEYAPGADGLFCKKCGSGTSTFDPTVNPTNCPANGVGCQKCCEDPGVQCN